MRVIALTDAPAPPADSQPEFHHQGDVLSAHKVLQVRLKPAEISSPPKTRPIRPQIARAHRRSSPRRPMPLLMAWLERQLMRGIWAALDHPNPKN